MLPIGLGLYFSVLDTGAVVIALPTIGDHFDVDLATLQWVTLAFAMTIAALLLPVGRVADLLGRRRIFIAGFGVYAVGAVLSATAQDMSWLVAARALQAVGAASLQATGVAIALTIFPPEERGRILGLTTTTVALGIVTGPALGGLMVDSLGWRSIFLISAVAGPINGVLAYALVPRIESPVDTHRKPADWLGMLSSAVALVAGLLVLARGQDWGWTSQNVFTAAIVAVGAIVIFVRTELKAEAPMIDLRLFRRRLFAFGSLAAFFAFSGLVANVLLMPFYLQGILEITPRLTGLMIMPHAVMLGAMSMFSGRLSDRIGARTPATVGMLIACGSYLALATLGANSPLYAALIPIVGTGMGMGLFSPPNNNSILSAVERERYGVAAAFIALVRNTGGAIGVALATLMVTAAITAQGVDPNIGALRDSAVDADPRLIQGFVNGMRWAYLTAAGLVGLAAALSAFRGPRRIDTGTPEAVAPEQRAER